MKVNHLNVVSRYTGAALGGDAHLRLYRLPVVTGGAESQEGGGIARAWIEDPNVYPGIPMPKEWRWVPEGTMVLKIVGFCCYYLPRWLQAAVLLK